MVMRLDRRGVNIGTNVALHIRRPQYTTSGETNPIILAGDVKNIRSIGRVMPAYISKRRLRSEVELFDMWRVEENIQFTLDSFIPEIDRMLSLRNVRSNVGRDASSYERGDSTPNTANADSPLPPLIAIMPDMYSLSPTENAENAGAALLDGEVPVGRAIIAEGEWVTNDMSFDESNVITYDVEFKPNIKYITTTAIPANLANVHSAVKIAALLTDYINADRYHDFLRDLHYIDGINQNDERERRMGLFAPIIFPGLELEN